jgi:hypothetical protein
VKGCSAVPRKAGANSLAVAARADATMERARIVRMTRRRIQGTVGLQRLWREPAHGMEETYIFA